MKQSVAPGEGEWVWGMPQGEGDVQAVLNCRADRLLTYCTKLQSGQSLTMVYLFISKHLNRQKWQGWKTFSTGQPKL